MTNLLTKTLSNLPCQILGLLVNKSAEFVKSGLLIGLVAAASSASAVTLTPLPPYLTEVKGAPMIMLNMRSEERRVGKEC